MIYDNRRRMIWLLASAFVACAVSPVAALDEFHAFLQPSPVTTSVDSVFTMEFFVDPTARDFNGYDVTIAFDSTLVEFVEVNEGPLMIDACNNRFKSVVQTDSTFRYTHILLCGGVSIDGPGVLSSYTFRALRGGMGTLDLASDPDKTFLDDGLYVRPTHPDDPRQVVLHDAELSVLDPVGASAIRPDHQGLSLIFCPNPARGAGVFRVTLDRPGRAVLQVVDVAGREVFTQEWPDAAPGVRLVPWNITREGAPLTPGVYLARLRTTESSDYEKAVVVR